MASVTRIQPCLWFDAQAEDAARCYTGIFPDSTIDLVSHYGEAGREQHRRPPGSVMAVAFTLAGQPFLALNGGPVFQINPAISFMVNCDTQAEIDHYWSRLGEGGDPAAQQCGWLKDRFGVSWQIVPRNWGALMASGDAAASGRAMALMMTMKKLDIAALQRAFDGR